MRDAHTGSQFGDMRRLGHRFRAQPMVHGCGPQRDAFILRDITLPKVNTDLNKTTLQRIGQQVSRQFKRYDIPFSPYDLRHAWAVRTIHVGLPDTVAARMMGHSVTIHTRTYHHWITRRDQQQAVDAALARQPA